MFVVIWMKCICIVLTDSLIGSSTVAQARIWYGMSGIALHWFWPKYAARTVTECLRIFPDKSHSAQSVQQVLLRFD